MRLQFVPDNADKCWELSLYVVTAAPRAQAKTHFWSDLYHSEVCPGTSTCQTDGETCGSSRFSLLLKFSQNFKSNVEQTTSLDQMVRHQVSFLKLPLHRNIDWCQMEHFIHGGEVQVSVFPHACISLKHYSCVLHTKFVFWVSDIWVSDICSVPPKLKLGENFPLKVLDVNPEIFLKGPLLVSDLMYLIIFLLQVKFCDPVEVALRGGCPLHAS